MKATYLISAQNQSPNTNAVNLQLKLKEKKNFIEDWLFGSAFTNKVFSASAREKEKLITISIRR